MGIYIVGPHGKVSLTRCGLFSSDLQILTAGYEDLIYGYRLVRDFNYIFSSNEFIYRFDVVIGTGFS
jgi:hypothetical protein